LGGWETHGGKTYSNAVGMDLCDARRVHTRHVANEKNLPLKISQA